MRDVAWVHKMHRQALWPARLMGGFSAVYILVALGAAVLGHSALLRDDFFTFALLSVPFAVVFELGARVALRWVLRQTARRPD